MVRMQRLARFRNACSRLHPVLIGVLLAVAYFFVQLAFINEYGVTWDEPLHRNWGKLFALFLKMGDRNLLELMPGRGIYYGPVYYLLNYLLSEWLSAARVLSFVASNHLLNLITASISVACLFVLATFVGGRKLGALSVLSFVLFPPFLAHSHYNPKDIPLLAVLLLTATVFSAGLLSNRRWLIILAAGLFGVSVAFKISALIMALVFFNAYFEWMLQQAHAQGIRPLRFMRRELPTFFLALLAVCVGVVLAWPTAWGDIGLIGRSIAVFLTSEYWQGKVLFFGREYGGGALPWFYTPLEFFMVTPVFEVAAFAVGTVAAVLRIIRNDRRVLFVFLLTWFFFPLVFSLAPGLVRYDGMRQFFFILPAFAILCGLGFLASARFLAERFPLHRWIPFVLGIVVLLSLAAEVAIIHPFEGSYRNVLVRLFIPRDMDQQLQIEYWGATYKQGMDWLTEHAEPNPVICVPTAGILVTWYPWREDFTFECSRRTNYVMFFTRYTEAGKFASLTIPPVYTISRYNSALLKIYKI
ncbi:MAG: hypothetical protein WC840_02485 [Candidatus Peribacteraceae bacterium]